MRSHSPEKRIDLMNNNSVEVAARPDGSSLVVSDGKAHMTTQNSGDFIVSQSVNTDMDKTPINTSSINASKRKSQIPRVLTSVSDGVRKTAKFIGKQAVLNHRSVKRLGYAPQGNLNMPSNLSGIDEIYELKRLEDQHDQSPFRPTGTTSKTSPLTYGRSLSRNNSTENSIPVNDVTFNGSEEESVVRTMEWVLRHCFLFAGSCLLGVKIASNEVLTANLSKAFQFVTVAWTTCTIILLLTFVKQNKVIETKESLDEETVLPPTTETPNLRENDALLGNTKLKNETYNSISEKEITYKAARKHISTKETSFPGNQRPAKVMRTSTDTLDITSTSKAKNNKTNGDQTVLLKESQPGSDKKMEYQKELDDLYVMRVKSLERATPNSLGHVFELDNDLFYGKTLCMIKTENNGGDPFADYFREKKRRFEFQFQIKFKKVPENPLFFVCELDKSIKLGTIQRAFVKATLNFVKKMNSGFHYNLSGTDSVSETNLRDGNYESTLMAFTINSMDRLVETKPGETIPKIGCDIFEDPEALKKRKKKVHLDFNTESTYTMAFWSAYADLLQWKALNFPAIKPFSLSSVIGDQAFRVVIYTLKPSEDGLHLRKNISVHEEYEVSNVKFSQLGRYASDWIHANKTEGGMTLSTSEQNMKKILSNSITRFDSDQKCQKQFVSPVAEMNQNIEYTNDDNNDYDNETVEELGEGIYLKSGDDIYLRDASSKEDSYFLSTGGGFAILQSQTPILIQIEKPPQNGLVAKYKVAQSRKNPSKLIHSGDIVIVKRLLDGNENDPKNVQYLTTHKRKWLKWVSTMPKQNGFFQIFTNEIEGNLQTGSSHHPVSSEMQTSYVRLGGSFFLNHVRWSCYSVGTTVKTSARLGGRVLALISNQGSLEDSDDDDEIFYQSKDKKQWSRPLQLTAEIPSNVLSWSVPSPQNSIFVSPSQSSFFPQQNELTEESKSDAGLYFNHFRLDVPAWIEMAHRMNRTLQRVYVVRLNMKDHTNKHFSSEEKQHTIADLTSDMSSNNDKTSEEQIGLESTKRHESSVVNSQSFTRLRTGKDLTMILRVGLNNSFVSSFQHNLEIDNDKHGHNPMLSEKEKQDNTILLNKKIGSEQSDYESDDSDIENLKSIESSSLQLDISQRGHKRSQSDGNQVDLYKPIHSMKQNDSFDELPAMSEPDYDESIDGQDDFLCNPIEYRSSQKKKKWISNGAGGIVKVAKGVKTGTGHVVKQGKKVGKGTVKMGKGTVKVGKGTVNAGRAITNTITTRASVSSIHEPRLSIKTNEKSTIRKSRKDHHVAVNKTLKDMNKQKSYLFANSSTRIMAGQLSAPDQSCRTVSQILSEVSKMENYTDAHLQTGKLLESQLANETNLDSWFLRGGSTELGITPENPSKVICQSLVARCLWESHWREEWYGTYDSHICFYAPLKSKSCLTLAYVDIQDIRRLESTSKHNPLPAFPMLIIETAWRCYYLAFIDEACREECMEALYSAIYNSKTPLNSYNKDAWRAHLLQSFQISNETNSFKGGGKWANISSHTKSYQRIVLNDRKMSFDVEPFTSSDECDLERSIGLFVEELLAKALSMSLESFEESPEEFVNFLNYTSRLKCLPLHKLDYDGKEAFCIFINLYHCLLQHALLLSSSGPPTKRTFNKFMKTNCYEIGGDVFSLAEIECCVIRGAMSLPINPRPPFSQAPKRSVGHRAYALRNVDPRINFILHSGDNSKGTNVPILSPSTLNEKMKQCTMSFLCKNIVVDSTRKSIILPKVCDVYRNDFGGADPNFSLSYCLQYLDEETQSEALNLVNNEYSSIKYQNYCDKYVSSLKSAD